MIADQCLHGFRWNGVDHTLIPAAEFLDEVADEQRNVFFSFPQRWHPDGEDIQPIIQIRPESLLLYHGLKIAIRRGDQSCVSANGARAAQAFELPFLQNTQQLRLQFPWDFANLIQENGSAIRQ